jgi:hypothetical protein
MATTNFHDGDVSHSFPVNPIQQGFTKFTITEVVDEFHGEGFVVIIVIMVVIVLEFGVPCSTFSVPNEDVYSLITEY